MQVKNHINHTSLQVNANRKQAESRNCAHGIYRRLRNTLLVQNSGVAFQLLIDPVTYGDTYS